MIFRDIQALSDRRVTEIREYIEFINVSTPQPPIAVPRYINSAKGLVFVQLYGIIEYTVNSLIEKTIEHINNSSIRINELKSPILSLALHSHFDSLNQANRKKWDKRYELFEQIVQNSVVKIDSPLMPTDGKNIQMPQLESIAKTLCLTPPTLHDIKFRSRIQEIVRNRISIAHGNESAADIGMKVTTGDLTTRLDEVSEFCSFYISKFNDYIKNKEYYK